MLPVGDSAAISLIAAGAGGRQPGGAATWTMLLHLGQARILPMAATSRTLSLAWQVVQVIANNSMCRVPESGYRARVRRHR